MGYSGRNPNRRSTMADTVAVVAILVLTIIALFVLL